MMSKPFAGAVLMLGFVGIPSFLHAQAEPGQSQPNVTLSVCNPGKVDIDVLIAKANLPVTTHVVPNACADVYSESGAPAASVGFAFTDSTGRWGTPHRLDLIPDFGLRVLTRADRNVSARRGNQDVPAQLVFTFQPPLPGCREITTGGPRMFTAVGSLPLNASPLQVARAVTADDIADAGREPRKTETVCDHFLYTFNVIAYPDTRELSFVSGCPACPLRIPAAQRRAIEQQLAQMVSAGAAFPSVSGVAIAARELERMNQEDQDRMPPAPPKLQHWPDLVPALRRTSYTGGFPPGIPRNVIIRGTVSRIEATKDVTEPVEWLDVSLRESPDEQGSNGKMYPEFDVCVSDASIFKDVFGPDFRTSLIGREIEVEGRLQRRFCRGIKSSVRVTLAHQIHQSDAARVAETLTSGTPGRTAPVPAAPTPRPATNPVPAAPGKGSASSAAPVPRTAAAAGAAPAPVPPSPVSPAPLRTAEQQRAEQAAANQKRAQKFADCRRQAAKDHPEGGVALVKEYTACIREEK